MSVCVSIPAGSLFPSQLDSKGARLYRKSRLCRSAQRPSRWRRQKRQTEGGPASYKSTYSLPSMSLAHAGGRGQWDRQGSAACVALKKSLRPTCVSDVGQRRSAQRHALPAAMPLPLQRLFFYTARSCWREQQTLFAVIEQRCSRHLPRVGKGCF